MDTNAEIRRRRLTELCSNEGGVRAVAAAAGVNWQSLDQVIKGVLLPEKADGTRSPKALGDDTARQLEKVYDLGRGWFDWPFDHVDFKLWASLDSVQRVALQGRLEEAIHDILKKRGHSKVLDHVMTKKPVSDKQVEKHFKLPAGAAEAARRRAHASVKVTEPLADEPELPMGQEIKE